MLGSGGCAAVAYIFVSCSFTHPLDKWNNISIGNFVYPFEGSGVKILAIFSLILLTWINVLGAKKGGNLSNIITAAKIIGILTLIIAGIHIQTQLFYP